MWWLLLWPLLGLMGWGWYRYSLYRFQGGSPQDSVIFVTHVILGPGAFALNAYFSLKFAGRLYWGLRFK